MGLDITAIRLRVTEKKRARAINDAILHQNRIKFHVETRIFPSLAQPVTNFLAWVSKLLPKDKFALFQHLFRFPLKSVEVTKVINDKLSRVFDGRNPAFNYQFLKTEQRDDWEYYRQTVLDEPRVWQSKAWDYFKTEINCVMIVDLPREGDDDPTDKYAQPYFYFLTIDQVIDFDVDYKTGNMEYIIFHQPDSKVLVIDDESYRLYEWKDGNVSGEPIVDTPHELGYCPARFFWSEPLVLSEPFVKGSPMSCVLESLDWFLFFHTSKRHLDLYGAYPIYTGYAEQCDFKHPESGNYCRDGFLRSPNGEYILSVGTASLMPCPVCGDKRFAGAGTYIEVPIPSADQPDLSKPLDIVSIDSTSLEYNVGEYERIKTEIIQTVVGEETAATNDKAINELQVSANYESLTTVLNKIKKGFEEAQNFVDETVCRLRYGKSFVSADVNLGTDFYVSDPNTLRAKYKMAKESGASESELDAISRQILETEYRSNPVELQRMLILSELEPFQHYSRDEVIVLKDKGLVSDEELVIKLKFNNFVRRFERENTNIIEFGTAIPFDQKIKVITDKFKEYANENTA